MNEIIYVLINVAMPGYVKIGRTTNLEQRIRTLDTTSMPLPFECFYACKSSKTPTSSRRQLHDAFMDHRVRSSREFFEISPDRAVAALKLAGDNGCHAQERLRRDRRGSAGFESGAHPPSGVQLQHGQHTSRS